MEVFCDGWCVELDIKPLQLSFLQRISIACYAKHCISYRKSVRLTDWPSITRWYKAKTIQATITGSSL